MISADFLTNEVESMQNALRNAEQHVIFVRGNLNALTQLRDKAVKEEADVDAANAALVEDGLRPDSTVDIED